MPAEHDFSPEELQEFAQHGVIIGKSPPAATANEEVDPAPATEPAAQAGDQEPARDPTTGQFVAKEPTAAPATADPTTTPTQPDPTTTPAPPPGYVPHQALHAERVAKQQLAAQMATLQARTNALLAARQPDVVQMPDLQQDPVAYVQTLEERVRAFEEQRAEEENNRAVENALRIEEENFRVYTPDYDAASEHYVNSRARELLAFYPPQEAQSILMAEARQLAQEAWQRGIPAPQMVYMMAQARGYNGPQSQPAPAAQQPPATQQSQPAPAATAPSAAAVVAAASAGQQAVRTLSGGSAAPATTLNAEALLSMSDEEFERYLKLGQRGANERFAALG